MAIAGAPGDNDRALREALGKLAANPRDESAWWDLYAIIRPSVYAIVYRCLCGRADLADDACQVVFIKLFKYCDFGKFQAPSDLRRYVSVIARNVARSQLEVLKDLKEGGIKSLAPVKEPLDPSGYTPQSHAVAREQLARLRRQLREPDRRLLQMILEGRSREKMAQTLGTTAEALSVRVHRLRNRIRNLLTDKE